LWGYGAAEALGSPITIIVPPERSDESMTLLPRLLAGERLDNFEAIRRRKDGSLVEVAITFSRIHDRAGQVVGSWGSRETSPSGNGPRWLCAMLATRRSRQRKRAVSFSPI
jgi:PAS domain S-box-containing protein